MQKDRFLTAAQAGKLADNRLQGGSQKTKRKDRKHKQQESKPHSWQKTFPPKDFSQLLHDAGHNDYQAYLESPHWKTLRSETLCERGFCAVCKATGNLRLHHCDYRRLGHELPDDLIVLCDDHHAALHEKLNIQYPLLTLVKKVLHSYEVLHLRHPGSQQQARNRPRV